MEVLAIIQFAVLSSYIFAIDGSFITPVMTRSVRNDSKEGIVYNNFTNEDIDGESESEEESRQAEDTERGDRITVGNIHNGSASLSMFSVQPTKFYSEKIKSDAESKSTALNNDERDNQIEEQPLFTTSTVQITSQGNTDGDKIVFNKIKPPKLQYGVQSESPRVHTWRLDFNRIPLQHHFHLLPMEKKPLDSSMIKEHNYLIGILVPASLAILGAVLIIGTICSLRYIARKRARQPHFDNIESPGPGTPCISSIRSDSTDKVSLLREEDAN